MEQIVIVFVVAFVALSSVVALIVSVRTKNMLELLTKELEQYKKLTDDATAKNTGKINEIVGRFNSIQDSVETIKFREFLNVNGESLTHRIAKERADKLAKELGYEWKEETKEAKYVKKSK